MAPPTDQVEAGGIGHRRSRYNFVRVRGCLPEVNNVPLTALGKHVVVSVVSVVLHR